MLPAPAGGVTLGEVLLPHVIARGEPAGQDISTEVFIDVFA
jgi:hypothetical protein